MDLKPLARPSAPLPQSTARRRTHSKAGLLSVAVAALLAFVALLSWTAPALAQLPVNCPVTNGTYDPNKDYFPNKVSPKIAQYMSVTYQNSYKILRNTLRNETYVLYLCNTPRPAQSAIPNVRNGTTVKFVEIPLKNVGCSSRSAVTYLERLQVRPAVRYVSSTSIMTSACLLKMANDGVLQSYPASGPVSGIDVNFARGPGPAQTNASVEDISVTLSAVWEDTPMQKFEWLLFISTFFNLESQATALFKKVSETYACNAANVLKLADKKPVVAWLSALDDGTFVTVDWTYRTQLLLDAGVTALISPSVAPLSDVQTSIMDADVLIDDTAGIQTFSDFLTVYGLKDNNTGTASKFKFLANKKVFKTDRKRNSFGIDDFAQSSWGMPDLVQHDLLHVLWPDYLKNWTPVYLRNIAFNENYDTITAAQCPNNDTSSAVSPPELVCTPLTPSAAAPTPAPSNSVPVAAIVGGVLGGVCVIAGIGLGAFFYKRKKNQQAAQALEEGEHQDTRGFVRMEDGSEPVLPEGAAKVLERRGTR